MKTFYKYCIVLPKKDTLWDVLKDIQEMNPKYLMKPYICSGCQSVSPLKSTLYYNAGMAIYRIINCSMMIVPLVETIYPISSFDELCITGLRRYSNRIELTYFVKISNIFLISLCWSLTLPLKPIIDPSHRLKKTAFILHLTKNIFMSILAFPSHNSQNRRIVGHTFLNSRFSCFPKKTQ